MGGVNSADTIAAIATAPGRGGVGVIRISGSNLLPFAFALTGKTPKPRHATLADFRAADGAAVDSGILLFFPGPHSFTGEDVLELQGHGGPVVMQMLLARCLDLGARLAEPGEFSRRAFLNGKLDLAQAEAVADLIDAATASAARSAVRSLQGEFSQAIHALTDELINLRMLVEATLDFPDEDIDFLKAADAFGRLERLQLKLAEIFDRAGQGKLLQAGLHVVLAGQPNVGKSSLLNRLAGDELAIVTPVAGTTRDALRSTIQIEGIPLHIIDTAGLRETEDEVEKIGIERSWREIERADVVLLLVDARSGVGEADREILARLPEGLKRVTVYNKIDLSGAVAERHDEADGVAISLSAKANQGIELLRSELLRIAGWHPAEDVFIARERHLRALAAAQ
ncbi:MAG TPA: tRNA uridine-5-carboxymethylaminomethyl(34) synthesis GTPase MnmE, partial [Azonexus sp.]|nr:tRNA uridine-5-carboxymethylaminomethyl(34) synthesis GTPase MnmE [Azonexus sp.]